ncbi:YdcF family protein [Paenibacillus barcinonensis]|uniref:YdcF family protein n=1 Tax=Paenibacillus barcinonensis TaxID=198119 RepID=UPI001C126FDF|nr:YdcF family protein [Paenibacillus barcinonensis]MBU5351107.1 YdcF family protein [Paenibacillus barcinonensis]
MYLSQLNLEDLEHSTINKIIFENLNDDGQIGDIILVFGSVTAPKYRVPKAVELLNGNRAKKIIMSGGRSDPPEALIMKEAAISLGASESDILLETKSTNTAENIIYTKSLLEEYYGLKNIKRILLVTNYFHLKRCLLSMKTFMPEWIDYSLCGVLDTNTRPDNWWTNEKGKTRVINEIYRLVKYTKSKEIIDCLI